MVDPEQEATQNNPEASIPGSGGGVLQAERVTPQPILRASNLSRSFGETRALRSCSFDLRPGEVHAIVGENGSGKSTLVKILSGVIPPGSGTIEFDGKMFQSLRSPYRARKLGVSTVFQEVLIAEERSILENVWLGSDGVFTRRVSEAEKVRIARSIFSELTEQRIDLSKPIKSVDLSARQICVTARALVHNPRVLILDESTAALDISDRDRLFAAVRKRCALGAAIIFISHRIDEIQEIAARITVLRSGESVQTLDRVDADPHTLVMLMSGREMQDERPPLTVAAAANKGELPPPVLRVRNLRVMSEGPAVDVEIRRGEVVGIAGLEGHGQGHFLRMLAGLEIPDEGSVIRLTPKGERQIRSSRQAVRNGIAYVPRDRATEGIFAPLSIAANFSIPSLPQYARFGVILYWRLRASWPKYAAELNIKYGRLSDKITTLSGGNQQKVVIARWLAVQPDVLLLNDPTRGVDLATKEDVHSLFRQLAAGGMTIVLLSTEVTELVSLVDRTLVFHNQGLFQTIGHEEASPERLVAAMFGRS
jgi:ABC-type sugar transport system ATPase subunit